MAKISFKKVVRVFLGIAVLSGSAVLLLAAIHKKQDTVCKAIDLEIEGEGSALFLDRNDVIQMLTAQGGRKIKGVPIRELPLKLLEKSLENNIWIRNAELFVSKEGTLHVRIQENQPIARIFSIQGNSWYVDEDGLRLPLSEKFSPRLPVFTGFPTERPVLAKADSLVLNRVVNLALFFHKNPLWMAQINSVHITAQRNFECYPVLGNHVIELGDAQQLEQRFARLHRFYEQVAAPASFRGWLRVKTQFNQQIVAVKDTLTRLNN